jgi:hypothetical protein
MTKSGRHLQLTTIPGMPAMLAKAALSRKQRQAEPVCQPLSITAVDIRPDASGLVAFNEVCSFVHGDSLPMTYPHVMAFALHMQLMLEPEFPFSPMGAVHVRNRIRQRRAIGSSEVLNFSARLDGMERVGKGYEVSIVTEVYVQGELVWDDLSVMLIRRGGDAEKKSRAAALVSYPESTQWPLAANLGRRYAAASGDYNPIHLYPLTAKLLGFRRQIVHGMWSKSRCVAHLLPADYCGPASVDIAFKLPIFLPATVTLLHGQQEGGGSRFELRDAIGEKPHLAGELSLTASMPG